ncbi:MAG: hypothetical protein JW829_00130 [Pirellulales bacterium]|nr:hypothetical protein [Pirellulales bacterium]
MELHRSGFLRAIWIGSAVACFLWMGSPLTAQDKLEATISVDISGNPGGGFLYEYLISNSVESTLSINTFVMDVGLDADLQNITGPAGWYGEYDPAEHNWEMAWLSLSSGSEIPIGGQGLFSFTSPLAAEPIDCYLANLAPDGNERAGILGTIRGPSIPIPEPASGLLFVLILALIAPGWRMIR